MRGPFRIDLRVDKAGKITEAAFSGQGCAISQASADLLVEFGHWKVGGGCQGDDQAERPR